MAENDETQAGAGEEQQTQQTEQTTEQQTAATSEQTTEQTTANADASAGEAKSTPTQDWRDRRIAQLTAQLHEARAKAAPQATSASTTAPAGATQQPGESAADFEARVAAEVEARTQLNEFNRACNDAADTGRNLFGKEVFDGRIAQLTKLVNGQDPTEVQRYNTFISAMLETGEAPGLIHALGQDLNEASRIMGLTPVKMGVELAKLASKLEKPDPDTTDNQMTRAPKPITPLGARNADAANISPDDRERADHLSTAEWMRKREQQIAAKRAAA